MSPAQFLRHSSAKPQLDSSILNLSVVYPKPAVAVQLANVYAHQFVLYATERDVARIERALSALDAQIKALRAQGATGSPAYDEAVATRVKLQRAVYLFAHQVRVRQPAERASSFRPHALRAGIVGGFLRPLLGIALVAVLRIGPKNSGRQAA